MSQSNNIPLGGLLSFAGSVILLCLGYFFGKYRSRQERIATDLNETAKKLRETVSAEISRIIISPDLGCSMKPSDLQALRTAIDNFALLLSKREKGQLEKAWQEYRNCYESIPIFWGVFGPKTSCETILKYLEKLRSLAKSK